MSERGDNSSNSTKRKAKIRKKIKRQDNDDIRYAKRRNPFEDISNRENG